MLVELTVVLLAPWTLSLMSSFPEVFGFLCSEVRCTRRWWECIGHRGAWGVLVGNGGYIY